MNPLKRLLLFCHKARVTRRVHSNARGGKLGVELAFVTDRCGRMGRSLERPALSCIYEKKSPKPRRGAVFGSARGLFVSTVCIGLRPIVRGPRQAYVARGLGPTPQSSGERGGLPETKLRTREVFREAGIPVPWFRGVSLNAVPRARTTSASPILGVLQAALAIGQPGGGARPTIARSSLRARHGLKRLLESPEIRATREPHLDQLLV